jgi:hypothetical protein
MGGSFGSQEINNNCRKITYVIKMYRDFSLCVCPHVYWLTFMYMLRTLQYIATRRTAQKHEGSLHIKQRDILGQVKWTQQLSSKHEASYVMCNSPTVSSPQHSPNISRSSCALPSANTGIKHLPPRFTMSWTRAVNRLSRSSRFSWMWVPYVDSCQENDRKRETPQYWTELKYGYGMRTMHTTVNHSYFIVKFLGCA